MTLRPLPHMIAVALMFGVALGTSWGQSNQDGARQPRPEAQAYRIRNLSPELERVLKNWEQATSQIETLQGDHGRFVYDHVFEVEKRAEGVFYYQSPDKGRIDINAIKVEEGALSPKKSKQTGQNFKLQSDRPERWICDGAEILQINDEEKTVEKFPIPREAQGKNIMDGPLPFLFGMPAAKAKLRYELELIKETEREVWLHVKPRWKQDAANWKEATVILEKHNYLPRAVQLVDPAGNLETVYTFANLKVNQQGMAKWLADQFGAGNWFQPNLRGFKMVAPPKRVPNLVGTPWKDAEKALKDQGYVAKLKRGGPAPSDELVYSVAEQKPEAGTPFPQGGEVVLILYDKPAARVGQRP